MPAQHSDTGLTLSRRRDTSALKWIPKNRLTALRQLLVLSALLTSGCSVIGTDQSANKFRELTIIYTNDEHGWMEGMEPHQSAAHLFQLWREQEGYYPEGPFLVLSGGDNWTGPAISTWSEGRSMVEAMNAMQYDASAVGNHEFDFGLDVIKARAEEADFPYLSANTRWRSNGLTPTDLGILPYTVTTVNDIRVGIVGLTTLDTPTATNPDNVRELDFLSYERALRETLPALEAEDTDINLVIAHVCQEPLEQLIYRTQDLDIALFGMRLHKETCCIANAGQVKNVGYNSKMTFLNLHKVRDLRPKADGTVEVDADDVATLWLRETDGRAMLSFRGSDTQKNLQIKLWIRLVTVRVLGKE